MKEFSFLLLSTACLFASAFPVPTSEQESRFWNLYQDCLATNCLPRIYYSSDSNVRFNYSSFRELEGFGIEILCLIYKAENTNIIDSVFQCRDKKETTPREVAESAKRNVLGKLWSEFTWQYTTHPTNIDFVWAGEPITKTWQGGEKLSNERAMFLLNEIRSAKQESRRQDGQRAKANLAIMGIFSLPVLFHELELGHEDVIEVLGLIEWGLPLSARPELTRAGLLSWWRENKDRYALPSQSPDFNGTAELEKWKRLGK